MLRNILIFGTIAGLIVGVALSAIVIAFSDQQFSYGMLIGYTIMLVGLSTIFVAVKRYRDIDLGGVIGFWQALGMGLAISFVAGLFYVAAWEASVAITHMDFANSYASALVAHKKAAGVKGAELAKLIADTQAWKAQYANPLYRLPMVFVEIFPIGALISLFSAGLLSFRRFMPRRAA